MHTICMRQYSLFLVFYLLYKLSSLHGAPQKKWGKKQPPPPKKKKKKKKHKPPKKKKKNKNPKKKKLSGGHNFTKKQSISKLRDAFCSSRQGLSHDMLRSQFWWGKESHSARGSTHYFLIVFLYLQWKTSNGYSANSTVSPCNSSIICCHSNLSLTPPLSCSPSLYAMK